jgi:hypothetical protein
MMKQEGAKGTPKQLRNVFLIACAATALCLTQRALATGSDTCATNAETRQLDFWLGNWKIGGPGAGPSAKSNVSIELDQCMVVERWDGGRGHRGENIFGYSPEDQSWHGLFADNMGRVHVFVDGQVASGAAEFIGPSRGPNGEPVLNRVRIVRIGADTVNQTWEKSADNGATWKMEFRGEYSREK